MAVPASSASRLEKVVLKAGPSLDFRSAPAFRQHCETLAQSGTRVFIVDLSETEIIDSTGLGALFTLYRQIRPDGGRIVLAAPTRAVVVVIALTKCDRIFDTYPSIETALHAVSTGAPSRTSGIAA